MFSLEGKKKAKKNVTMLTTIHEAVMVETGKTDFFGNKVEKPEAVYYYCGQMGGVDLSDQLLNYYSFLRKSMKVIDSPAKFANSECIHSEQKLWMRKIDS